MEKQYLDKLKEISKKIDASLQKEDQYQKISDLCPLMAQIFEVYNDTLDNRLNVILNTLRKDLRQNNFENLAKSLKELDRFIEEDVNLDNNENLDEILEDFADERVWYSAPDKIFLNRTQTEIDELKEKLNLTDVHDITQFVSYDLQKEAKQYNINCIGVNDFEENSFNEIISNAIYDEKFGNNIDDFAFEENDL